MTDWDRAFNAFVEFSGVLIECNIPSSRENSLAITKIEEAFHWLRAAREKDEL